jgi:hypothetical protein
VSLTDAIVVQAADIYADLYRRGTLIKEKHDLLCYDTHNISTND